MRRGPGSRAEPPWGVPGDRRRAGAAGPGGSLPISAAPCAHLGGPPREARALGKHWPVGRSVLASAARSVGVT